MYSEIAHHLLHKKSYTTTANPLVRGDGDRSPLPKLLQWTTLKPGGKLHLLHEQKTQQNVPAINVLFFHLSPALS